MALLLGRDIFAVVQARVVVMERSLSLKCEKRIDD